MNENNRILTRFLRRLATAIEKGEISGEELTQVGEFYVGYKYAENGKVEENEFLKFLIMGWYVYEMLKEKIN